MRITTCIALLIALAAVATGQSGKGPSGVRTAALPADINSDSLNRLPVVKREQTDEKGKQVYDHVAGGAGKIASPTGPASIELYSPGAAEPLRTLNEYLRRPGNLLGNPITELAILVAAREGDSQYIWSAHEPAALKAGLAQPVIDAVKYNKDATSLGEKEGTVVRLGRQVPERAQTGFRHFRESRRAVRKTRNRGAGPLDGRLHAEQHAARRFRPAPSGGAEAAPSDAIAGKLLLQPKHRAACKMPARTETARWPRTAFGEQFCGRTSS